MLEHLRLLLMAWDYFGEEWLVFDIRVPRWIYQRQNWVWFIFIVYESIRNSWVYLWSIYIKVYWVKVVFVFYPWKFICVYSRIYRIKQAILVLHSQKPIPELLASDTVLVFLRIWWFRLNTTPMWRFVKSLGVVHFDSTIRSIFISLLNGRVSVVYRRI